MRNPTLATVQFAVKYRRSKWTPRKAITKFVAKYVAAMTTSFFTNESSSFEQISTGFTLARRAHRRR